VDDQHSFAGVVGRNWYVVNVVYPVPQGAKHDRESVNEAKMKLCSGFHNSFASKQTIVCV